MSPLVWDLAHIGQQEELWLLRGGNPNRPGMLSPEVDRLYDAFVHSRASRVELPLLPPAEARTYCATVRDKALDNLDALPDDLTADAAFRFGLVISHENQHDETMLQALNLRSGPPLLGTGSPLPPGRSGVAGTSVLVPAGEFVLGVDAVSEPHSLDNERPAHVGRRAAFRIGRVPVTNGEWRQFIDDGGYEQQRWWSDRGWTHRQEAGLTAPQFWNPGIAAPAPASGTSRRSPTTNPCSTSPTSRPRRTRRGRARACPPRWSGRRPPPGTPRRVGVADSLGAHRNPPNTWRT